jgi:hypothetical protein
MFNSFARALAFTAVALIQPGILGGRVHGGAEVGLVAAAAVPGASTCAMRASP